MTDRCPRFGRPIRHWVPTSVGPSGMAFVTSDRYPGWKGSLLIGTLREQALLRLSLDGRQVVAEERLLASLRERIRDVRQGPEGAIYLLTDNPDGRLLGWTPERLQRGARHADRSGCSAPLHRLVGGRSYAAMVARALAALAALLVLPLLWRLSQSDAVRSWWSPPVVTAKPFQFDNGTVRGPTVAASGSTAAVVQGLKKCRVGERRQHRQQQKEVHQGFP